MGRVALRRPGSGDRHRGKAAISENLGIPKTAPSLREEVTQMTEEGNVVVAEGAARVTLKDGTSMAVRFCDIFGFESAKIRLPSSLTAMIKNTA